MRYNRVMLTDKGRDLTRRTRALFDRLDEELFAGFTLNECEQLYGYLCRMTQILRKRIGGADMITLMAKEQEEMERRRRRISL